MKAHPELVALGFWMRRANLDNLRNRFQQSAAGATFHPKGTAFHIAPSNVDSIFIYSWFLSMLCGNKNIVRLSSRSSPQLGLLISALGELLEQDEWRAIAKRVLLVRYEHDADISTYFSSLCDVRVIWGGNLTVSAIRNLPLPPHACEVAFADKFSLALIHAKNWNNAADSKRQDWLNQFFNDAYWFGQMACSSPRMIVWHGDKEAITTAQESFWHGVSKLLKQRETNILPVDFVNKLVAADLIAIRLPTAVIHGSEHNDICRVEIRHDYAKQLIDAELHCGAGLFFETSIGALDDLLPMLDRRIQTVSYAGYPDGAELREFAGCHVLRGVDRIVPFGKALEFSSIWDGFDLFRIFLRQVSIV